MPYQGSSEEGRFKISEQESKTKSVLVIIASFIIIVAGMHYSAHVLIPFLLSLFIAIICAPPLRWLQQKGVPSSISVILILSMLVVIGTLIMIFVGSSLNEFSRELPNYQNQLKAHLGDLLTVLNENNIQVPRQDLNEILNPAVAMTMVANTLGKLGGALTNTFLVLLTVSFILLEASSFKHKIRLAFDNSERSIDNLENFMENVNEYLAIKSAFSFITGVTISIGLWIIGLDHPLLWGLLAFLLNYVPNIGSIIAAVPAVLLALVQLGPASAGLIIALYVGTNMVLGNILEPRFMGRGLGLSTLVVFVSLVFWGSILGPVGMLLSIPLTMILKIALENDQETQWIAVLLSSGSEAKKELKNN